MGSKSTPNAETVPAMDDDADLPDLLDRASAAYMSDDDDSDDEDDGERGAGTQS